VSGAELASRSDNTPFEAMELPATVTLTMLRGKVTARDGRSPTAGWSAATGESAQ
jgi:dihydroorotase